MAKVLTQEIPMGNNENDPKISFLDTVRITTGDIDVIASRIAVRKILDLGWEIADLNNLVPLSSYPHLVNADTLMEFLKKGSIKFLKDNLAHMEYAMEKRDEIRRETYIEKRFYSKAETRQRHERYEQEEQRGEVSRYEYPGGMGAYPLEVTRIVYSGRQRSAPRLLFFRSYLVGSKRCWRLTGVEIPKELARLILKMLPDRDKFVPIDYLVINPEGYLFVELKANNAKLSKKQLEVSNMIRDAGYRIAELHVSVSLGPKAEIRCGEVHVVKG